MLRVENPDGVDSFLALGSDWNLRLDAELPEDVTTPAEDAEDPEDDDVVPSDTPRTPWCTMVQLPMVAYRGKSVVGNWKAMGWPGKGGLLCIRVMGTVVGSCSMVLVEQMSGGVLDVSSGPSQPSTSLASSASALCNMSGFNLQHRQLTVMFDYDEDLVIILKTKPLDPFL